MTDGRSFREASGTLLRASSLLWSQAVVVQEGISAKAREAAMLPSDGDKVIAGTRWDGRMPVSCHDPLPVGHRNPGLGVALGPSYHNMFPVSL